MTTANRDKGGAATYSAPPAGFNFGQAKDSERLQLGAQERGDDALKTAMSRDDALSLAGQGDDALRNSMRADDALKGDDALSGDDSLR